MLETKYKSNKDYPPKTTIEVLNKSIYKNTNFPYENL